MATPDRPSRPARPSGDRPAPRRNSATDGKPPRRRPEGDGARKPPYQRRDGAPAARGPRRDDGERKPYQRRDEGERKPPYQRRDGAPAARGPRRDDGERKPYQRRDGAPATRGPRRDDGERKPYQRRDEGERKPPYQRRDGAPATRGPRRDDGDARPPRREFSAAPPERPTPKGWGGVTRRGARQVTNPTPASDEAKAYERREMARGPAPTVDRWEREPKAAAAPRPKKAAAKSRPIRAKSLPPEVVAEVAAVAPSARRAPMLQKRLGDAARHLQQGRDSDAVALLRPLAQEVPEAASVRELYGQALYALGRYRLAAAELEAFVSLSSSTEQHPVLADSYRALGRHKRVQELWLELRESSPSPDIVAEGRIVAAGSLGDQGKLDEAIKLLETAPPLRGRVQERHLRTWFALADLYERSGELAKARTLFQRIRREDPDFVDVADRLRALG